MILCLEVNHLVYFSSLCLERGLICCWCGWYIRKFVKQYVHTVVIEINGIFSTGKTIWDRKLNILTVSLVRSERQVTALAYVC